MKVSEAFKAMREEQERQHRQRFQEQAEKHKLACIFNDDDYNTRRNYARITASLVPNMDKR